MNDFLNNLQESAIGSYIGETAFPYVEVLHVIALAIVAGTIFMVDTRLIWKTQRGLSFTFVSEKLLPWTWWAFVAAAITGTMLLISAITSYIENGPLIIKFVLLALAGVNMAYFHLVTFKDVARWDNSRPPPAAIASGYISLILWAGVLFFGRYAGFQ